MAKQETDREKWAKRWWIGTPTGGSTSVINPPESDGLIGMDGDPIHGMDGEPIKPMT